MDTSPPPSKNNFCGFSFQNTRNAMDLIQYGPTTDATTKVEYLNRGPERCVL